MKLWYAIIDGAAPSVVEAKQVRSPDKVSLSSNAGRITVDVSTNDWILKWPEGYMSALPDHAFKIRARGIAYFGDKPPRGEQILLEWPEFLEEVKKRRLSTYES